MGPLRLTVLPESRNSNHPKGSELYMPVLQFLSQEVWKNSRVPMQP